MAPIYTVVVELLGGAATLKADVQQEFDLISVVRAGIPAISIRWLADRTQTPISQVGEIVRIDKSTLMRRLREKRRLKPDESDRVLRFARTFALAQGALGDKAHAWLNAENRALGGAKPIELLDTDSGAREVENVLGRIEHGVFS
jgi:putative toxin-antitoxin system antitoxin component (TIGR02293 family)